LRHKEPAVIDSNFATVFDSGPLAPLCENMTSSAKPEVHNTLQCRQRKTEPWPQVTGKENFVKFGRVVFEIFERTHRQTDTDTLLRLLKTLWFV